MNSARRGREWEDVLTRSFQRVERCTVIKTCAPVRVVRFPGKRRPGRRNTGEFTGYFEKKGACDYEGAFQCRVVCLEAKRTKAKRWAVSAIAPHQYERMAQTFVFQNGICGVLLAWDDEKGTTAFFAIDFYALELWKDHDVKSIKPEDLMALADDKHSGVRMLSARPYPDGLVVILEPWLKGAR